MTTSEFVGQIACLQSKVHTAVRQSLPPQVNAEHNLTVGATQLTSSQLVGANSRCNCVTQIQGI